MSIDQQGWNAFTKKASDTLAASQPPVNHQPYIQILFEPSFDDHSLLHLSWDPTTVTWQRTTWLRSVDAAKFDPIENLKYIGVQLHPTLSHEQGETDISKISPLLDLVRSLSIPPLIDKSGGIILDGCHYTLTIGVDEFQTTYKWHRLPDEWTRLQQVAGMLEDLNESFL